MRRFALFLPMIAVLSCRKPARPMTTAPSLVGLTWRAHLLPRAGMQTRIIGDVRITPSSKPNSSLVVIEVEGGALKNMHPWVIRSGNCDAGVTVDVGGRAMYPVLELGTDGRAKVSKDMPIGIPLDQRYHVAVFAGRAPGGTQLGTDRDFVVSCGELAPVTR